MGEWKASMGMDEFWGWVGCLKLRAVPIEEQRKRALFGLRMFAQRHNKNVKRG